MQNTNDKSNPGKENDAADKSEEAARGKKAIDAGLKSNGKEPGHPAVKEDEKKDADKWRNEG